MNGGGGIRTHGTLADTLVFKTRALNHSTTPPTGYSFFMNLKTITYNFMQGIVEFLMIYLILN